KSGFTIEIIDFEDCQLAPREFDVLNCLARLEYMGRFPHRAATYDLISHRFLNGYGKSMERTPIYRFLYLLIKLDVLESYQRRITAENSRLDPKVSFLLYRKITLEQIKRIISDDSAFIGY